MPADPETSLQSRDRRSRRDRLLDPYFQNAKPDQVVAIVKAREPARILVAFGDRDNDSPHLEYKQRWVNQFNWLAAFTAFLSDRERKHAGCQHRLFFSRVEYCDNLVFHRRAAVDELTERLLDLNRSIGQPNKITLIFGRKVTKEYKGSCKPGPKISTCPIR